MPYCYRISTKVRLLIRQWLVRLTLCADHFDKQVQERLRKDLPIVTTLEACKPLVELGFSEVTGLSTWESALIKFKTEDKPKLSLRVVSTPGKHVAGPIIEALNDFMAAVPPTTGFVLEFLWDNKPEQEAAFRIYISGDTLFVKDLEEIPKRYPDIDLLIVHLGGTTIPGPHLPLLMVTMDAKQGIKLVQLIKPKVTLPVHFDGE
jgi:L-ascorbate metabolism protein UlaG (beta-lactamase superfamily)